MTTTVKVTTHQVTDAITINYIILLQLYYLAAVFVSGVAGFVGSHVAKAAMERGYKGTYLHFAFVS
jgi:nucleoside-diphosphate-sugar epimerase